MKFSKEKVEAYAKELRENHAKEVLAKDQEILALKQKLEDEEIARGLEAKPSQETSTEEDRTLFQIFKGIKKEDK